MEQKHSLVLIAIQLERIGDLMAADMKSRGLNASVEAVDRAANKVARDYIAKFSS